MNSLWRLDNLHIVNEKDSKLAETCKEKEQRGKGKLKLFSSSLTFTVNEPVSAYYRLTLLLTKAKSSM